MLSLFLLPTLIFFAISAAKHLSLNSTAFDTGSFDQALYLISQSQTAYSTLAHKHILADHAAWSLYLIAPIYILSASPISLFLLQAIALGVSALLIAKIAERFGNSEATATAIGASFLLCPVIWNKPFFDFHPEVLALPAILGGTLAVKNGRNVLACILFAFACGTKELVCLPVIALGFALTLQRKPVGFITLILGSLCFYLATEVIIPHFSPGGVPSGFDRFGALGSTKREVIESLIFHPTKIFDVVDLAQSSKYLFALILPIAIGLNRRSIIWLIPAAPIIAINVLSNFPAQRFLNTQYSLLAAPFLFVAFAAAKPRFTAGKIMLWSASTFFFIQGYFWIKHGIAYPQPFRIEDSSRAASKRAIECIPPHSGAVLSTATIIPQLSERANVRLAEPFQPAVPVTGFDFILLNFDRPGYFKESDLEAIHAQRAFLERIRNNLDSSADFTKVLDDSGVQLWSKKTASLACDTVSKKSAE